MLFLFLLMLPVSAYADMGTPVMIKGFLHLLIGNLIIGIFEGLLIWKFFKTDRKKTIKIMILANYASMLVGVVILYFVDDFLYSRIFHNATIYNARYYVAGFIAATFILTIILEWPFCFWAIKDKQGRGKRALYASLLVQTVSYVFLVQYYIYFNNYVTLYGNDITIEQSSFFASNKAAHIYFISNDDGQLYRINIDGRNKMKVKLPKYTGGEAELSFQPSVEGTYLDLYLNGVLLKKHILPKVEGSDFWHGPAGELRPEGKRVWKIVVTNYWGYKGLRLENNETGGRINFGFNEPGVSLYAHNATVLPGDQVVFQFGEQIVLLDLNTKQLGLITMGHDPVVITDDKL